jgi:hypothetical protein
MSAQMGQSDSGDGEDQHDCKAVGAEKWNVVFGFVPSMPLGFALSVLLILLCS